MSDGNGYLGAYQEKQISLYGYNNFEQCVAR